MIQYLTLTLIHREKQTLLYSNTSSIEAATLSPKYCGAEGQ